MHQVKEMLKKMGFEIVADEMKLQSGQRMTVSLLR